MTRPTLLITLGMLLVAGACTQTTVTVLTQAPPGRSAFVDPETRTLTITRGVAVAMECTEWAESYGGPCRDFAFSLDDDALAQLLPVHLDALPGQSTRSVAGSLEDETQVIAPQERTGLVLSAVAEGTGTLTVSSASASVAFTVQVEEPPTPAGDADEEPSGT